ncbi:MAG: hypothetical protein A4E35_01927 [Methanoregula sp. PtaU1.Bin051]|nr:MAG: hypothetical protein A4E35_01927 [Methanoregula sp. PtaU1.Bin051]
MFITSLNPMNSTMDNRIPFVMLTILLMAGGCMPGCITPARGEEIRVAAAWMDDAKTDLLNFDLAAEDLKNETIKLLSARSKYENAVQTLDTITPMSDSEKQEIAVLRKICVYNLITIDGMEQYAKAIRDAALSREYENKRVYTGAQMEVRSAASEAKRALEAFTKALAADRQIRESGYVPQDELSRYIAGWEAIHPGAINELLVYTIEVDPLFRADDRYFWAEMLVARGEEYRARNVLGSAAADFSEAKSVFRAARQMYGDIAAGNGNYSAVARDAMNSCDSWISRL